jgi:hypothetical protein
MKQTAVEWLFEELHSIEKFKNYDDSVKGYLLHKINSHKQAKEIERQQQDEFAIGFKDWCNINEGRVNYSQNHNTKELLQIYKKEKGIKL